MNEVQAFNAILYLLNTVFTWRYNTCLAGSIYSPVVRGHFLWQTPSSAFCFALKLVLSWRFMNRKKIRRRLQYGLQYFPLTLNFLLLAVAAAWLFETLHAEQATQQDAPSSFIPFLTLMGKTALGLLLAIISFCLLSVVLSYVHFLWLRKKKGVGVLLDFSSQEGRLAKGIRFKALLDRVRRPWLGVVRVRLLYDDGLLTSKLTLLGNEREKGRFFRKGILGKQALQLPDIKTYQLQGSFVFFEDMLHLFSLASFLPQTGHFFQAPRAHRAAIEEQQPQQATQADVRVETSRLTPGDYVHYKDFEGEDDIRRIVWQVYAKSRSLVVRIPERRDFYASHLSFYASFHTGWPPEQLHHAFAAEMLNYYKNCIWTAVSVLLKKDVPLKFIPDQPFETAQVEQQGRRIQMQLSYAYWHRDMGLDDYFPARKGGVICLSSFNDPEAIRRLLETSGRETMVYFVPLSRAFRHWVSWGWLKRIFVKAPLDRKKRIRSRWPFSPLRYRLLKREKSILALLKEYDVRSGILK